jgi:hypothetical protein
VQPLTIRAQLVIESPRGSAREAGVPLMRWALAFPERFVRVCRQNGDLWVLSPQTAGGLGDRGQQTSAVMPPRTCPVPMPRRLCLTSVDGGPQLAGPASRPSSLDALFNFLYLRCVLTFATMKSAATRTYMPALHRWYPMRPSIVAIAANINAAARPVLTISAFSNRGSPTAPSFRDTNLRIGPAIASPARNNTHIASAICSAAANTVASPIAPTKKAHRKMRYAAWRFVAVKT